MLRDRGVDPRKRIDIKAAIVAGLLAGAAFLVVDLAGAWIFTGMGPWAVLRMTAAIVLGSGVLPPPATFSLWIILVALGLHFVLSMLYAVVGIVVARPSRHAIILTGALFGLLLYILNLYILAGLFPWFQEARDWVTFVTHIVFGVVVGMVYGRLSRSPQ